MASFFLIRLLIAVSAGLLAAAGDLELLLHFKASLPSPEVVANWVDGGPTHKPCLRAAMTLGQACPPEYQGAQCAFKDSMIH